MRYENFITELLHLLVPEVRPSLVPVLTAAHDENITGQRSVPVRGRFTVCRLHRRVSHFYEIFQQGDNQVALVL